MVLSNEEAMVAQLRKGTLDYVVLAALKDHPAHGHGLAKRLARHPLLVGKEGTIYPVLTRLRRSGWIAGEWEESPGGPPRRILSVTSDGEGALSNFVRIWDQYVNMIELAMKGNLE